ncbi:acyl-CoA thioesterase [Francisellaceae bacterium]|nr:acyl-CoA thioesterase [Francisellaceae bacterium]
MKQEIVLEIPMRWMDMDAYQHMNSGRYLDYTVESRLQWMGLNPEIMRWVEENKLQFVMVKQNFEYFKPIVYPCMIVLTQKLIAVGNSSIEFDYCFSEKDNLEEVCTSSQAKLVCFDPKTKRSQHYPLEIKEFLLGLI